MWPATQSAWAPMYRRAWHICSADSKHKEGDFVSGSMSAPGQQQLTFALIALINHQAQAYVRARAKAHEITAPSRTQQGHCGGGGFNVEGGRGEEVYGRVEKRGEGGEVLVRFSQLNHACVVATRLPAFKSACRACFQRLRKPFLAGVLVEVAFDNFPAFGFRGGHCARASKSR